MYKFVKIKMKGSNSSGVWYFKPENIEQMLEHWHKYCCADIHEGMNQIVENIFNKAHGKCKEHYTSQFAMLVDMKSMVNQIPVWQASLELENELFQNRLDESDKDNIYYADGLTRLSYVYDIHEIVEEIEKDNLVYPEEFSIDNVKYLQWYNGKHWYAKMGKIDIVDENGNQKWNTREEAENAVKKYIEKYSKS